jgi:hypothetical protein
MSGLLGSKPKPNHQLLQTLVQACIFEFDSPLTAFCLGSSDQETKEARLLFEKYISDMLPFYLGLVCSYLQSLYGQTEYTIEDIFAFRHVMELFQLKEGPKEQKSEEDDLTLPPRPAKLYVIDGFVEINTFSQLIKRQNNFNFQQELVHLSGRFERDPRLRCEAFESDSFWNLLSRVISKMMDRRQRSFLVQHNVEELHRTADDVIFSIQEDIQILSQELGFKADVMGTTSYQKEMFSHIEESKVDMSQMKKVAKKLFNASEEPSEISMLGSNIHSKFRESI